MQALVAYCWLKPGTEEFGLPCSFVCTYNYPYSRKTSDKHKGEIKLVFQPIFDSSRGTPDKGDVLLKVAEDCSRSNMKSNRSQCSVMEKLWGISYRSTAVTESRAYVRMQFPEISLLRDRGVNDGGSSWAAIKVILACTRYVIRLKRRTLVSDRDNQ